MFLGSGRAALLQLAHPWVAQAIEDHSNTRADPYGRFQRTFRQVFAMVYGDLDSALAAARRVHALHSTIRGRLDEDAGQWQRGSTYEANNSAALLWVHSTLWETSITVFERFVHPLSEADKEAYYQETRFFADLFGIPRDHQPASWEAFLAYNRRMWTANELAVTAVGRRLARFLFVPPDPLFSPLANAFRNLSVGLLPEPLRCAFRLPFGLQEQRSFERSVHRLQRLLPHLPRRLRFVPPYIEAERRLAGHPSRDLLGELLNRLYVGRARS